MASKRNPQNSIINSAASTVTVFANPSSTAFAYVWKIQLTAGGASNLTFQQSTASGISALSGPFDITGAGGSITKPDGGGGEPWYKVDPSATFSILNSGSAQLSGECQWSN